MPGSFIVYTGQGPLNEAGYVEARQAAEEKYRGIERMLRGYPERIGMARTADDVRAVAASGRLVGLIGMENAYPLGESVADVQMWA